MNVSAESLRARRIEQFCRAIRLLRYVLPAMSPSLPEDRRRTTTLRTTTIRTPTTGLTTIVPGPPMRILLVLARAAALAALATLAALPTLPTLTALTALAAV
jgi:hypothetical protein